MTSAPYSVGVTQSGPSTAPPGIGHLDFAPAPWACECPGAGSGQTPCDHAGRCGEPAKFYTNCHMVNECRMLGLTPDGGAVRLLCGDCTVQHVGRAELMADKARQAAKWSGRPVACTTCARDLTQASNFLEVKKLSEVGL